MTQLNDDRIGKVLKQVEANQRPDESTLSGLGREVRQLYQQWEQLLVQEGQPCWKVEDQHGKKSSIRNSRPRNSENLLFCLMAEQTNTCLAKFNFVWTLL